MKSFLGIIILLCTCAGHNVKLRTLKNCLSMAKVNTSNLIGHGEPAYAGLNYQWNSCCGQKFPLGYLLVQSPEEVQSAVRCARKQKNLRIVPKGGGHSFGKYSFGDSDSLIIDLQNLTSYSVDKALKRADFGPGFLMGQLIIRLWNSGKFVIPFGSPSIGIGFVLGGGLSEVDRLYGMAVDSLLEVDMVDATGRLLTANSSANEDLFWALRGGGAGSFGIVTRFQFKLHDAPERIVQGAIDYELSDFPTVFTAWQQFVKGSPDRSINSDLFISRSGPNPITLTVFQLQTETEGTETVRNILSSFPVPVRATTVLALSYLDYLVLRQNTDLFQLGYNLTGPSELAQLSRQEKVLIGTLRIKTFFVPKLVDRWSIGVISQLLWSIPKNVSLTFRLLGGVISDVEATRTAYVHRGQNFYEVDVCYTGRPEEEMEALCWMNRFYRTTQVLMGHTESYQDHIDIDLEDYLPRYYGINALRLMKVKAKYDSCNVFRNPQSVPSFPLGPCNDCERNVSNLTCL